ncbi:DUF2147 domain-containing protein [Bradyrhizobium australiense]|uniref:DUF2147 domain-containing protein n=1 Tax=Bradyrhizobium australiense TaxID=2721161 RepID=A0A7Y4LXA9_9BRAD|nr:DUF2147 domain-containing protein [Bradyrhizobium australiense]NOJ42044.1 DUF2147 domain-containing protein [Bradyrhizobium australiense]
MKRFCFLAVLMLLGSSAHARGSISFNIGGHRVRIESSLHCRSTSCASMSVSRSLNWRHKRDRYDDDHGAGVPAKAAPQTVSPPPATTSPVETAQAALQVERVSHQAEEEPSDSPIGDWQTEGKRAVRIGKCGGALWGYVLNSSSEKGEAILINMKPKTERQWTGSVYSQDSGETYYGTMSMKGINTLRVEACALGRFYCTGNNWSRITRRADSL